MKYFITDENGNRVGETILYPDAPKTGKSIALVIGHDQDSQGAYGNKGIGEWKFNDNFWEDYAVLLPKQHTYYVIYRSADINGYTNKMLDVHKQIDNIGCDIAIEFHFNGASDSSVNGNEVLYCVDDVKGRLLAMKLDECLDALPNRDRGVKAVTMKKNGGGFCCRGNAVSIISEPFFAAHQDKFMHGERDRETLFKAYYNFFDQL